MRLISIGWVNKKVLCTARNAFKTVLLVIILLFASNDKGVAFAARNLSFLS